MGATETISLRLTAVDLMSGNVTKAIGSLDKLAKQGGFVGSMLQGVGQSFGQMLNPMGLATKAFDSLAGVVGDAVGFMNSAGAAWRAEQADLAQFHQTLDANVSGWRRYADELDAAIDAGMDLAFADDVQRKSLGKLVTATGNVTKAIRLNRLAMDIARQRSIKLEDAADAVTKAAQGQGRALRALGYDITDTKDATLALAEAQRQAEGSALTFAKTAQGQLEVRLTRVSDNLEETGKYFQATGDIMADTMITGLEVTTNAVDLFGRVLENWGIITVKETEGAKRSWTSYGDVVLAQMGASRVSVAETSRVFTTEMRRLPRLVGVAVVDMKEAVKDGKSGIIEQFRDLAWQSKHPFASVRYGDWLEKKHREAMRKGAAAAKAGRPAVASQYFGLADEILEEWRTVPGAMGRITREALRNLQPLFSKVQNITPLLAGQWVQTGGYVDDTGAHGTYEPGQGWTPDRPKSKNKRKKNRAMGGPVYPGQTYTVGEYEEETLVMGATGGYVIPSGNGRSGGNVTVNVSWHSPVVPTEAEADRVAARLAPALNRHLARVG